MKSVQVSLKKIKATKMKQIVDLDFCNIWWLLKEPFVCESKLI